MHFIVSSWRSLPQWCISLSLLGPCTSTWLSDDFCFESKSSWLVAEIRFCSNLTMGLWPRLTFCWCWYRFLAVSERPLIEATQLWHCRRMSTAWVTSASLIVTLHGIWNLIVASSTWKTVTLTNRFISSSFNSGIWGYRQEITPLQLHPCWGSSSNSK